MLTLAEFADVKALDLALLERCGVHDSPRGLTFPYFDSEKRAAAIRYRPEWGEFRWHLGDQPIPYGVWHGPASRDVVLVEGESDSLTLWQHGIRALGVPGASMWKADWTRYLGRARPVLIMEPDDAGRELVKRLAATVGVIWWASLDPHKDASAAYLALGDAFPSFFQERIRLAKVFYRETRKPEPRVYDDGDCLEIAKTLTEMTKKGREWFGLCPFHAEKTPSFHVTPGKGFNCFGCGAKGGAGTLRRLADERR